MEISEINSPESLQKWLEDKPADWASIIGIRMVLRAAPLGFAAIAVKEHNLPRQQVENIVLTTFRMMFLAKVFCDYPEKAGKNIVSDANLEMIKKAYDYPDDYTYLGPAKFTLRALADFLNVLISSSDQIPSIASAAKNACQAIRLGDVTNQNSPKYAASSSVVDPVKDKFWSIIRNDADWINQSVPKSSLLMPQPLWLRSDNENFGLPDFITKAINSFKASDLAQNTSFGLIADWYIAALEGKSAFGESAELAIAKMSPGEWGDHDKERDCVAVMDRVAELAGWERLEVAEGGVRAKKLENEFKQSSKLKPETIRQAIENNRDTILLLCHSLQIQIADYKEVIRGKNSLDEETRQGLLEFLTGVEANLSAIFEAISDKQLNPSKFNTQEIQTNLEQFSNRFQSNLQKYFSPQHLADVSLPVSIILGAGAIGSIFGGPVGFGIGAFVGKLVTSEAKPGKVSDKLQEMYGEDDNPLS